MADFDNVSVATDNQGRGRESRAVLKERERQERMRQVWRVLAGVVAVLALLALIVYQSPREYRKEVSLHTGEVRIFRSVMGITVTDQVEPNELSTWVKSLGDVTEQVWVPVEGNKGSGLTGRQEVVKTDMADEAVAILTYIRAQPAKEAAQLVPLYHRLLNETNTPMPQGNFTREEMKAATAKRMNALNKYDALRRKALKAK